ncbi:MAG: GYD domain-containing protein [Candidatus Zixiibacteriota bacterium]|nr:MAG: GYD domain-containing protein [candidate division Zixibacteria bacterium]
MKTFVMMTKIAPRDADLIEVTSKLKAHSRDSVAWLEEINKQCPEVKVLAHYAILGPYDFMCIYEAPDEKTAAKMSLLSRARGAFQVESWHAIPSREISELVEGLLPAENSLQDD